MFEFHDPGRLVDGDLVLVLAEKYPGDPAINYVPAYRFQMTLGEPGTEIGHIELRVGDTNYLVMYGGHLVTLTVSAPTVKQNRDSARPTRRRFAVTA